MLAIFMIDDFYQFHLKEESYYYYLKKLVNIKSV